MEDPIINNNNNNSNIIVSAGSPPPPPAQAVVTNSLPQVMNMNVGNSVVGSTSSGGIVTNIPAVALVQATTTTTTPGSSGGGGGGFDLFGKKKRGRPRKYDSEGNLRSTYKTATQQQGFTFSTNHFSSKKTRGGGSAGRPTAFGNYQLLASYGEVFANSATGDFTPHVVTVYTGEDVAGKIMSFAQKSPRGICILSANGAISNVTLRQPGSLTGILTYEGRFEILSLSGSFTVSDNSDIRSRSGGLSVSLAGPDGRVIGGGVAGLLTAAGPIQIVVGSFMPNGDKPHKRKYQRSEHKVASPTSAGQDTVTAARPISQANAHAENFQIPTMSHDHQLPEQIQRESISVSSDKQNLDATPDVADWNGSEEYSDQRTSPDINISLSDE